MINVSIDTESNGQFDPFWVEHASQIRKIEPAIKAPKTRIGKKILKEDSFNNPIFKAYNRLSPLFGSIVAIIEYDVISKAEGRDYFSGQTNQRMVLRAFNMRVEEVIKSPYFQEEAKKYEDYRSFFEGIISGFRQLENQIQSGGPLPDFINSLVLVFSREVTKIEGIENFKINTPGIRNKVKNYLPELRKKGYGEETLSAIKESIESALGPHS